MEGDQYLPYTPQMPWWDRKFDDYQQVQKIRQSWRDGGHLLLVVIESGQLVDDGTTGYMEPPSWMPYVMEEIKVRPIYSGYGRFRR